MAVLKSCLWRHFELGGWAEQHIRATMTSMRSTSLPAVRVTPELKQQLESVLVEGETISALVERAVRQEIDRRKIQAALGSPRFQCNK